MPQLLKKYRTPLWQTYLLPVVGLFLCFFYFFDWQERRFNTFSNEMIEFMIFLTLWQYTLNFQYFLKLYFYEDRIIAKYPYRFFTMKEKRILIANVKQVEFKSGFDGRKMVQRLNIMGASKQISLNLYLLPKSQWEDLMSYWKNNPYGNIPYYFNKLTY